MEIREAQLMVRDAESEISAILQDLAEKTGLRLDALDLNATDVSTVGDPQAVQLISVKLRFEV